MALSVRISCKPSVFPRGGRGERAAYSAPAPLRETPLSGLCASLSPNLRTEKGEVGVRWAWLPGGGAGWTADGVDFSLGHVMNLLNFQRTCAAHPPPSPRACTTWAWTADTGRPGIRGVALTLGGSGTLRTRIGRPSSPTSVCVHSRERGGHLWQELAPGGSGAPSRLGIQPRMGMLQS